MSKQIQKSLEKTKQIQKSLRKCVSKIKIPKTKPILFRFNSCKHLSKTSSFSSVRSELDDHFPAVSNNIEYSVNSQQQQQQQEEHKDNAVTLSDVDRFLFENFRSLFEDELTKKYGDKRGGGENGGFRFKSSLLFDPPPIIPENISRRIRASRFFVRTDSANSLVRSSSVTANYDSSEPEDDEEEENESAAAEDFITLLTYSPSPYEDFRRSMMEMVKVRREHNGKVDWQFMEELLFCYLDLNNKKSYRYILRAFVDLAGVLRENSSAGRIGSNRRQLKVGGGKRQLRGGDLI